MKEKIIKIAASLFKSVLLISFDQQGTFRIVVTVDIRGEGVPLLVLGNTHSAAEDGHCIAILNPDRVLLEKVQAGCAYSTDGLKKIVQGKCDLMVDLWIDAYKENSISEISSYVSRDPKPAKFTVR